MSEPRFAEEEPRVLFWGHVWVTPAVAQRLQMDAFVHGGCFLKVIKAENGLVVGERVDPLAIRPADRGA